jgi:hypothetical protein
MEGLDGYMARIVGWVVVCDTARKKRLGQRQLRIRSSGMDRPAPNDPWLLHNQPSVEVASFSKPSHQAAGVEQRVQGRGCAGHQALVAVEAGDADLVPIQKSLSFSLVESEEATGARPWMAAWG